MKQWAFLGIFMALFFSRAVGAQIPGLTQETTWQLSGYVKYTGTVNLPDDNVHAVDHLLEQRFNYEYRVNRQLRFNAAMRNRLLLGDSAEQSQYAALIAEDRGYLDLSTNWLDKEGRVGNTQLDRLYLDWSNSRWQVRGGRSRINWAMATLWSPNDIFNAYSIYDIDYLERAGSDALLLQRQLDFVSSVAVTYKPYKNSRLNSYAARYLSNNQGWDWQLLAAKTDLDYLLGGAFAGELNGAGLRSELSWFKPTQAHWQGQPLHDSILATIESDYRFSGANNCITRVAALYISAPQKGDSAINYLNFQPSARTLSFARFTYYAELGWDLSPLSRLTLSGSYYSDGSLFAGVSSYYFIAENWQLQMVMQRFDGSASSFFGVTPRLLAFAQVKWSF